MSGLRRLLRWIVSPTRTDATARPRATPERPRIGLADTESPFPPATVTDPAAWDQYWKNQLDHGFAGFVHMFCNDGALVDAMAANGLRTILCVGSGLSLEPRALAAAGFDVTVLDLSPLALQLVERAEPEAEFLGSLLGGRPFMPGGGVRFVTGDLRDSTLCAGPFDVVIERRTLQLFSKAERPQAMQAVANRLARRGIFFSHCHDGRWKPPAPRNHATESWFLDEGWPVWTGWTGPGSIEGRVAWLFTSTG